MNVWTFLLIVFFTLLGLNAYVIHLAAKGNVVAGVVIGITGTLTVGIIFYGLREFSQWQFNKQKMQDFMLNEEENSRIRQHNMREALLTQDIANKQNRMLMDQFKTLWRQPALPPGDDENIVEFDESILDGIDFD